jgi:hypothetical protein
MLLLLLLQRRRLLLLLLLLLLLPWRLRIFDAPACPCFIESRLRVGFSRSSVHQVNPTPNTDRGQFIPTSS